MNSILSVSAINTYISFKLKNDSKLKGIAVSGEISDLSISHVSGHLYFTLTDGKSSLMAVMFAGSASRLKFRPESGLGVVAFGNIEVYEKNGVYQLICTQLIPSGQGAEYVRLMQLRQELSDLGVFSSPKKAIPKYPKKIAVVTSPVGAAIRDVISVSKRRYPLVEIDLFPALVQGTEAPASISAALKKADLSGADVIILTRGGGSSEDLSCFNTKEVVMAVYSCTTPVVSAVGHEIDYSFCDLAADLRAPTPSGAAELCTPDINEMITEINYMRKSLKSIVMKKTAFAISEVRSAATLISAYSPKKHVDSLVSQTNFYRASLESTMKKRLDQLTASVSGYKMMLSSIDPMKVLSRGYAIVSKGGSVVTSVSELHSGDVVQITLKDGSATAEIADQSEDR